MLELGQTVYSYPTTLGIVHTHKTANDHLIFKGGGVVIF